MTKPKLKEIRIMLEFNSKEFLHKAHKYPEEDILKEGALKLMPFLKDYRFIDAEYDDETKTTITYEIVFTP